LKGIRKFIRCQMYCTARKLEALTKMQIEVGGQVVYPAIRPPTKVQYTNTLEAFQDILEKEKKINQLIIEVHSVATKNNDPQVMEVVIELLQKSVKTVKDVSVQITTLQRLEGKMGEFLFDRYLLKEMQIRKASWEVKRATRSPNHCCAHFPTTPTTTNTFPWFKKSNLPKKW